MHVSHIPPRLSKERDRDDGRPGTVALQEPLIGKDERILAGPPSPPTIRTRPYVLLRRNKYSHLRKHVS